MNQFTQLRRQQFLTSDFYKKFSGHLGESPAFWAANLPEGDSDAQRKALAAARVADDGYKHLSLRYTAGCPIEQLRDELDQIITAYEIYQERLGTYEGEPQFPAFNFEYELDDYERCMQLIGLCYLLHRRDLLPRIAKLQDPAYAGEDTLYEELLGHTLKDRADVDEWYHDQPYSTLIHAMYAETPQEASTKLAEYCRQWYPAMEETPWHGSHERMTEDDGDYFGYWAFEAGAVALLYGVDDSKIEHMVYPRDLVAFARSFDPKVIPESVERVPAGKPVPRTGWWYTPAKARSRRHFRQGEVFPRIDNSDYGETFWLWDADQDPTCL